MEIQPSLEEEIKKIEEKILDAQENLGDVEVRDAIVEKGDIYVRHNRVEEVHIFEMVRPSPLMRRPLLSLLELIRRWTVSSTC